MPGAAVSEETVSRREFDDLRQEVRSLSSLGTTIAVLSQQLSTVQRDMNELKLTTERNNATHNALHREEQEDRAKEAEARRVERENEAKDRRSSRRWLVTTGITGLAAMAGLYGWIALFLHH